jgi:hypothetical protein
MPRVSCGCKFADPDSAAVRPDTMSCGSDGCRDGSSGGGGGGSSGEFRRSSRPSKVAADDSVEPARCSDAGGASPASWIDRKLLVDPKMLFVGSKIGEGAHGKVYKGK